MATQAEQAAKLQVSIDAQAKKLAELKAKKAKIEARGRFKEKSLERKNETRRLVLMGAFVNDQLVKNGIGFSALSYEGKKFDDWLTRPEERALFKLLVQPQK